MHVGNGSGVEQSVTNNRGDERYEDRQESEGEGGRKVWIPLYGIEKRLLIKTVCVCALCADKWKAQSLHRSLSRRLSFNVALFQQCPLLHPGYTIRGAIDRGDLFRAKRH